MIYPNILFHAREDYSKHPMQAVLYKTNKPKS